MRFSNRKAGRTGVAYLSRRVRRRCARSSGCREAGWCSPRITAGIDSPWLFKQEGLPKGFLWTDVQRLIGSTSGSDPRDIRDHAILMLLAIYGLRGGEVRGLRLEDLDWTREVITIRRPKQRRTQYYPIAESVVNAILNYLQRATPDRGTCRELFVTLRAPFRPLSSGGVYYAVSSRLHALGIETTHHGPHGLPSSSEADLERQNDSLSRFKRLRSVVLRRCLAKASVRREVA
jgi:integrase/recombinase XerD